MSARRARCDVLTTDCTKTIRDLTGQEFRPVEVRFEARPLSGVEAVVFGHAGGALTFRPPFPTWLPEPPPWWADAVAWVEGQE